MPTLSLLANAAPKLKGKNIKIRLYYYHNKLCRVRVACI
jgi:hypothetical protein